jgi:ubiquinone/menaquinone biosynthesis C-methylase UbiE
MKVLVVRALLLFLAATHLFAQAQRSEEQRAVDLKKRVVAALQVPAGSTVADVGCGDGFYTIPLARFLGPSGNVYAEDIDDKALYKLKQNLIEEHLENVEVEKGLADDPKLPGDSLDAALIANAYHEMSAHEAMLRHIRTALKQNGRLVLMERISNKFESLSREEQIKVHQLGPNFAEHELEEAGFEVLELHDPFAERPDDGNGKSRWWLILARKPAR